VEVAVQARVRQPLQLLSHLLPLLPALASARSFNLRQMLAMVLRQLACMLQFALVSVLCISLANLWVTSSHGAEVSCMCFAVCLNQSVC
jgi:hypothetical protein